MKYRLEVHWKGETYEQIFNKIYNIEECLIELWRLKFITKESYDKLYKFLQEFDNKPSDYGVIHVGDKRNIILEIEEDIKMNKTIDDLLKHP